MGIIPIQSLIKHMGHYSRRGLTGERSVSYTHEAMTKRKGIDMKTISTQGIIEMDGRLRVEVATGLAPGMYQVLVVVEEQQMPIIRLELPTIEGVSWPSDFTLRREDLYDDDGR